jgi:AcrR family transcriptional regulator
MIFRMLYSLAWCWRLVVARANRNAQRGVQTRERVVAIATRLFAERGYEGTSVEAVLQEAGISRGSLYHHFASKEALFDAVLEGVEARVGQASRAAAAGVTDPVAGLRAASLAWIRMAGDPVVQRILLIDAPSVLGWQRWRELDERHALGLIRAVIRMAAESGRLPLEMVDTFAHAILALLNEIALVIARADDPAEAIRSSEAATDEILRRLLKDELA